MKHLKYFENNNYFKFGDYVKCVDITDMSTALELNKIYYIYCDTRIMDINSYTYIQDGDKKMGGYNSRRFISATPEKIKQYKLEQSANKYNL